MLQIPKKVLRDGHQLDQLGVGTYKLSEPEAQEIVGAALEMGYRHIDTASLYGNEAAVGRAVADSGIPREDVWVTTKLWHTDHERAGEALRESLERLQLSYVDLFLIHWPTPERGTAWGAWQQLIELQQEGLVRSIGVSNFEIPHLERIIADTGVVPVVNQIEIHPEHQRRALRRFCMEHDIAVQSWSPLARGRDSLLQSQAVQQIAAAHGKTAAQVVLRWHVQEGLIVFPKTRSVERLAQNAEIFDFTLTDTEMGLLYELESGARSGSDPFQFNG